MHLRMIVCSIRKRIPRTLFAARLTHRDRKVWSLHKQMKNTSNTLKRERYTCENVVSISYKIKVSKVVRVLKKGDSDAMA